MTDIEKALIDYTSDRTVITTHTPFYPTIRRFFRQINRKSNSYFRFKNKTTKLGNGEYLEIWESFTMKFRISHNQGTINSIQAVPEALMIETLNNLPKEELTIEETPQNLILTHTIKDHCLGEYIYSKEYYKDSRGNYWDNSMGIKYIYPSPYDRVMDFINTFMNQHNTP